MFLSYCLRFIRIPDEFPFVAEIPHKSRNRLFVLRFIFFLFFSPISTRWTNRHGPRGTRLWLYAADNSCTLGLTNPKISRSVAQANKFRELGSTHSKSERKPPVHAALASCTRRRRDLIDRPRLEPRLLLPFPQLLLSLTVLLSGRPSTSFPGEYIQPDFLSRLTWRLMTTHRYFTYNEAHNAIYNYWIRIINAL